MRTRATLHAAGCPVFFLPSYSSDFNPIEPAFSNSRRTLRRVGTRTQKSLEGAIGDALELVTTGDALEYFRPLMRQQYCPGETPIVV